MRGALTSGVIVPYESRPTTLCGTIAHEGWVLREYATTLPGETFAHDRFASGLRIVLRSLPAPDPHQGRLGVGFVIQHQGRGIDYIVLCWWDRENELPIRVLVRDPSPHGAWRPADGGESVCVWDLLVIGAERDAYVATVMQPGETSPRERYLAANIEPRGDCVTQVERAPHPSDQ